MAPASTIIITITIITTIIITWWHRTPELGALAWAMRQWRQPALLAQALAVGVGRPVGKPCLEFAAWGGAVLVDRAVHAGLADFAAQGDASSGTSFRTLHRRTKIIDFAGQFQRHPAAGLALQFAEIEGDAEMGTTGAAGKTGIVLAVVCIGLGWICHMAYMSWLSARRRSRAAAPHRAGGNRFALHHQRKGA